MGGSAAEVVDIWTNQSYGLHTDYYAWTIPEDEESRWIGSARFVYVRPRFSPAAGGGVVATGCSAWGGGVCSSAARPGAGGLFW